MRNFLEKSCSAIDLFYLSFLFELRETVGKAFKNFMAGRFLKDFFLSGGAGDDVVLERFGAYCSDT